MVLPVPAAMPDVRALAALAQEMDRPLGFAHSGRREEGVDELGRWDGDRAQEPTYQAGPSLGALDASRAGDLADADRRRPRCTTASRTWPPPRARRSPGCRSATARRIGVADGDESAVSTDAGSIGCRW